MTSIEICNKALAKLGCNLINTLTVDSDSSNEVIECAATYPNAVKACLEDGSPTFAKAQRGLIQAPGVPLIKYQYAWQLPGDTRNVVTLSDANGCELASHDWERQGNQVLTLDTPVFATLIIDVPDTTSFSGLFIEALASYMAAEMCMALTESAKREADLRVEYKEKMDTSKYVDGKQGSMQRVQPPRLPGRVR